MTQNPDRSLTTPNCGRAGRWIVPYDFETAFSFRFAIAPPEPWQASRLAFARNHLFQDAVRDAAIDWLHVFRRFQSVTTTMVAEVCSTIPSMWAEIGQDVVRHVSGAIDHWPQFEQEIVKSLRNEP